MGESFKQIGLPERTRLDTFLTYTYQREDGSTFKVKEHSVGHAWHLSHENAYELLFEFPEGIEVKWLKPCDGTDWHRMNPECFPWDNFTVWIMAGDNRTITKADLMFLERDIDDLKKRLQRAGEDEPLPLPEVKNKGNYDPRLQEVANKAAVALKARGYSKPTDQSKVVAEMRKSFQDELDAIGYKVGKPQDSTLIRRIKSEGLIEAARDA